MNDFQLQREPASRTKPTRFESHKANQRSLFSGLDCLPGQNDLFGTDGVEPAESEPAAIADEPGDDDDPPAYKGRRLAVEFSQAPVRPNPDRGLIWLSDCARFAVVLGDRLFGDDIAAMGLTPLYRAVYVSPEGQRLIRTDRPGRNGRRTLEAAMRDCRRHERQMRLNPPRRRRRVLTRR